jgi:aryl-alcohol dehydrogenase-like predicted oxidoreductase
LALAWVLAQGKDIVPIPGTKREKYLLANVEASHIPFTVDELEQIDQIAPPYSAAGDRYVATTMQAYGLKK